MAPVHFFLFLKLKLPLPGTRFQSIEDKREFAAGIKVNSGKCVKNVLMIGLFVGISILFQQGPTLKEIK